MKTTKSNTLSIKIILTSLIIMMFTSFYSYAQKAKFLISSIVPAARGFVKIKKDGNHNYEIKIKLDNLAEAKRLEPNDQVYVVWMETGDHIIKNLGQIKSATSLLSKKLNASFETVSSFKPYKIFITTEDEASVQHPGSLLVLTTNSF